MPPPLPRIEGRFDTKGAFDLSMSNPRTWLNTRGLPWTLLLIFFLFPAINEGFHKPLSYEEGETLPYAKQFAQPDYVIGDWYFDRPQPVRRPYQILVYPLVKWLPLPTAAITARLVGYLLLAGALTLIALKLRIGALEACLIIGAYLWLDQSLPPTEEWLFQKTESKVIAYALILFALATTLSGRLRAAGLLAGLATTFHVIVGGWGTIALGLTVLSARLHPGWAVRMQALSLWFVGAGGALYFVLVKLGEPPASAGFDAEAIYVAFRMPHHLVPSYWGVSGDDIWLALLGFVLLAFLFRVVVARRDRLATVPAHFALWTALPYALGLVATMLPFGVTFLHYYPFRVGAALVLLLGLMVVVPPALRFVFRVQARAWVVGVAVAVLAADVVENGVADFKDLAAHPHGGFYRGNKTTSRLRDLCRWVKKNTPADALIIASPHLDVLQYHCERPVAVTFRMAPSDAAGLEEWYSRLVDFNGGRKPKKRGYRAARAIGSRFRDLSEAKYRALGNKYQSEYLLVRERDDLSFPKLFENRTWTLYSLKMPPGE